MTSVQTTIPFNIRKKFSFYSSKENTPKQECFINASLRNTPNATYTPTTKKLMVLSSSESESDSDTENVEKCYKGAKKVPNTRTPKTGRKSRIDGEFIFILSQRQVWKVRKFKNGQGKPESVQEFSIS